MDSLVKQFAPFLEWCKENGVKPSDGSALVHFVREVMPTVIKKE